MAADAGVSIGLVELDVADGDSVRRGFAEIVERFGPVDHLVNNAGVGANSVVEECPIELFEEMMNVNLYGVVRCVQAVMAQMRERGSGTIVNVSSLLGRIGALAQAPYTASKWALEAISEELAQEVAPFGIRVAIIEPGVTKTAIFAKNIDTPSTTGAYERQYARMFQMYAAGIANATDPFEVAEVIHHAIHTDQPKLRYPVSWGAAEIIGGRAAISDEQWVEIGLIADDADYAKHFAEVFGVDITTD
jgi:NAD(P)-dependent dehydrogenase (short-subunit alcohol dehydrogenase family)